MSSLPNSVPLAGPAVPPPIPTALIAASRPPRTWYFIGSTLFAVGAYAVLMIAQLATYIVLFALNGVELTEPEQLHALLYNGGWLAMSMIVSCPFVVGALWIPIRIARQSFSDYLGLRWPTPGEFARGLAMMATLSLFWFLLKFALGEATPAFMTETYSSAKASGSLATYVIGLCVAAPIMEELIVRGFLFRGWSQSFLRPAGTIVLTSVVWASLHTQYNLFYISWIFTFGIMLGSVRLRSGSTWLTVMLHATHNVIAIINVALIV
jgi:membrane protease YdiL (CAAX protease family)